MAPFDIFAFRQVGVWVEMENLSAEDPFCCLAILQGIILWIPGSCSNFVKKGRNSDRMVCSVFTFLNDSFIGFSLLIKLFLDSYFAEKNKFIF